MQALVKFFRDNYKLTLILSVITVIFGLMGLMKLNAESYPMVNFAMAVIETRYDGATASDIETKITKKIEDKIREVSGLKDVRSISKSGFSRIFVRVDMDNEDEEEVLDELQKAVDKVNDLPSDLINEPSYSEINSEEFPAIEIAIIGSNEQRKRDLLADHLKEELEDSKRVKDVRPTGFRKRQFDIRLDEKKLQRFHIGIDEVINKIALRNQNIPGGSLKKSGEKTLIRIEAQVENIEELENIVIRSNFSGEEVRLKNIATLIDSEEDATVYASYNGQPATLLIVNKKAGADTLGLVKEVDGVIERFKKENQKDFEIVVYNNEADKVRAKLDILNSNALSGLVLVVVFLFLFLPGKIGMVASLSLPLAVMATIGMMPIMGMNLDAITILALVIALGMLVDNSVVISENFARLKNEEGMSSHDAALESIRQLWLPITCTALTTMAAFLPMLVTKGIMGQFIRFIPVVVTISLLISLGESFFLLPMRLWKITQLDDDLANDQNGQSSDHQFKKDWFHKISDKFETFMRAAIQKRYLVFVLFGLALAGSFILMGVGNKFILFPNEQTEVYVARIEMPRGTTLEATQQYIQKIVPQIQSGLGKWQKHIVTRAGISKMMPTDAKGATGDNHGLIIMYASDYAKYNVDYKDFLAILRKIDKAAAKDLTFEAMAQGPPVGDPINATFRSNDAKALSAAIDEVKQELAKVPGVRDLRTDDILGEQEIKINVNYEKADRLGISVKDIGNSIRAALSGQIASQVTLDNKEVDLHVRYKDIYRKQKSDIARIKVMDRLGNLIPIMNLAEIELTNGSYEIKRFDFKRSKTLLGDVDETVITSAIANSKLQEIYNKVRKSYPDVSLVFGGQAESTKESMQSLMQAMVLSLLGIFGLLVFLFRSYLRPFIIMTTIPLGLIGFSVAFFLHQRPISFLAMIGVIGLGGIIVNSGIVLISFIDQLREEGKYALNDILAKASGLRLRAVLVTSLTTISGLIPTAYGIGGSDSMLVPMTLAMAWGLTSGTILTLIWVPCAYAILEDFLAWWDSFSPKRLFAFFRSTSKVAEVQK